MHVYTLIKKLDQQVYKQLLYENEKSWMIKKKMKRWTVPNAHCTLHQVNNTCQTVPNQHVPKTAVQKYHSTDCIRIEK